MKKLILTAIILVLLGAGLVSAALCQNAHGYYEQCENYAYDSYKYNTYNYAEIPIFKGSYGNYRYAKYVNGDYNPYGWFTNPSYTYNYPYFNAGYGGYGGYHGYPSYGYSTYSYGYHYPSLFSLFWF